MAAGRRRRRLDRLAAACRSRRQPANSPRAAHRTKRCGSLEEPGELTLRGQLDLTDMLRPAVQPGSKIDYEYPPESSTVTFETASPSATLKLGGEAAKLSTPNKRPHVSFTLPADAPKLVPFEIAA